MSIDPAGMDESTADSTESNGLLPAAEWQPDRFAKLLMAKSNGLAAELGGTDGSPACAGIPAYKAEASQVQDCVRQHMAALSGDLQHILQHVTDELATEVNREQQHLMLMQSQVDKLGQMLAREVQELGKRADHEKDAARLHAQARPRSPTCKPDVPLATREALEVLASTVRRQSAQIAALETQVGELSAPLVIRVMRGLLRLFLGRGRHGNAAAGSDTDSAAEKGTARASEAAASSAAEDNSQHLLQPLMSSSGSLEQPGKPPADK